MFDLHSLFGISLSKERPCIKVATLVFNVFAGLHGLIGVGFLAVGWFADLDNTETVRAYGWNLIAAGIAIWVVFHACRLFVEWLIGW